MTVLHLNLKSAPTWKKNNKKIFFFQLNHTHWNKEPREWHQHLRGIRYSLSPLLWLKTNWIHITKHKCLCAVQLDTWETHPLSPSARGWTGPQTRLGGHEYHSCCGGKGAVVASLAEAVEREVFSENLSARSGIAGEPCCSPGAPGSVKQTLMQEGKEREESRQRE